MSKITLGLTLSLAVLSSSAHASRHLSLEIPSVSGEVLVKIKSGQMGRFLAKKSLMGMEIKQQMNLIAGEYLLLKTPKATQQGISDLKSLSEVEFAEPNFIYQTSAAPTDPLYGKLWGLRNTGSNEPKSDGSRAISGVEGADIAVEAAWGLNKGSRKVVIAVIDTGIDYNHPDLKNNVWTNAQEVAGNGIDDDKNGYVDDIHGWNAFAKNGDPMDGNAHGTHCAGTIGAEHDNSMGVAGVMNEVSLMGVKFLSNEGSGTLADAVIAIDYATKMNVDIMSNSWGGGGYSLAMEDAIKAAKNKGILFVAAAGNDAANNDSVPHYPSNYAVDNVISVASHTFNDELSTFSCYGKKTVHVAAPGTNILSTTPNNQYKVFSGTSMATPHVSGALGLLIAQEGRLPVLDVRNRLMATSTPGSVYRKSTVGGGRLNAYNLLTDTRIPRPTPNENAWRVETLPEIFETNHPYLKNEKLTRTYSFPGAKYVKIVIEKYDVESGYDFITVRDAKGATVEKLSGTGANYETEYAETDSVTIEFSADAIQERWGLVIKEAKVIY